MNSIQSITGEEIKDSRGNPTLSVEIATDNGKGTFLVPSGASTGSFEAYELRDKDSGGMVSAIEKITSIIEPALKGVDSYNQKDIDQKLIELDGTSHRTFLGGNTMIGISVAVCKASAQAKKITNCEYIEQLENISSPRKSPHLYFNLINGGKHAKTKLAFQEYHVVPKVSDIKEAYTIAVSIQKELQKSIYNKYPDAVIGDEGGFAIDESDVCVPLGLLSDTVNSLGLQGKVSFALDVAASSFYDRNKHMYSINNIEYSPVQLSELYKKICHEFDILSIEDPFEEEDFESFTTLQKVIPNVLIVGDDLTVTNQERLARAIHTKSITGIIIKPNQVGTLKETFETINLAHKNGIQCIVSHRSGETMDDFIADLAYGTRAFGIKAGAPGPKEREVKYERLMYLTSHIK